MALLPAGMACSHCGNPATSLCVELLYGTSVLLLGLGTLILDDTETNIVVHHQHKTNLERLQRLFPGTPDPVVMFLAGSFPASGLLHLRMLSYLGMIARLGPQHILHQHGHHVLLSPSPSVSIKSSWCLNIRNF